VGYSGRSLEGQLYLTTSLFVAMEVARDALRRLGWMSAAEPRAVLPTGDGALLVFGDLQSAFAFIMALNMLVEDLNRGPFGGIDESVERQQPVRILPCEVRYALANGQLVEIEDITGRRNYVGEALVTCSRILSASKGAHFLVEDAVMAELLHYGGINEVAEEGDPWNWQQGFHAAKLQTRHVKSARFTFYNVFGFYRSEAFLRAVADAPERNTQAAAEFPTDGRRYTIGSHDVTALPSS
jgi:hypothetical protein